MQFQFLIHTSIAGPPEEVLAIVGEHFDHLREFGTLEALTVQAGELPTWIEGNVQIKRDPNEGDGIVWLEIEDGAPALDSGELRLLATRCIEEAAWLDRVHGVGDEEDQAARQIMRKAQR